jgi:hypothetical protein
MFEQSDLPGEMDLEQAQRLVTLLTMISDLDRTGMGFIVGHVASRNLDLVIEAYGELMGTELPEDA